MYIYNSIIINNIYIIIIELTTTNIYNVIHSYNKNNKFISYNDIL